MDGKEEVRKLVVPAVLAIATLAAASGCGSSNTPVDAAASDSAIVADAGFDAGCIPPEEYDPVSHTCIPVV